MRASLAEMASSTSARRYPNNPLRKPMDGQPKPPVGRQLCCCCWRWCWRLCAGGRRSFRRVEVELEPRRLVPEILQRVALPGLRGEDVKDAVEVVEDRPAGVAAAVDPTGEQSRLPLHPHPHLVDDRLCLAL